MNEHKFELNFYLKNGNTRYYDVKLLQDAIRKYDEEIVKTGKAIGTMDSPSDCFRNGIVSLEHASHQIKSIKVNEEGLIQGEFQILDTPQGKRLKDIFNAKLSPEYSMVYSAKDGEVKEIFQLAVVGIKD